MHDSALSTTDASDSSPILKPLAVDVAGAAILMGCGRRHVWSLITGPNPRLKSFKHGRVRRVRVADIEAYLAQLVDEDMRASA